MSLRARKGVAISWYCIPTRTFQQEIATACGLAMTRLSKLIFLFSVVSS